MTRYPLEGVVSWNMNTTCNYRCSYCTQRFVDDRGQWATDLPRFLAAFAALPGDWEIKLRSRDHVRLVLVSAAVKTQSGAAALRNARGHMTRAELDLTPTSNGSSGTPLSAIDLVDHDRGATRKQENRVPRSGLLRIADYEATSLRAEAGAVSRSDPAVNMS